MGSINVEYFKAVLEKYLDENHPELTERIGLLEVRSRKALHTYCELFGKGACHQTALEAACLELTGGVGFSLFNFVYELVFDHFNEIPDEIRRDFCTAILSECMKVKDSLSYEGMDECEAYYYFEGKMEEIIHKAIEAGAGEMLYGIAGNTPG